MKDLNETRGASAASPQSDLSTKRPDISRRQALGRLALSTSAIALTAATGANAGMPSEGGTDMNAITRTLTGAPIHDPAIDAIDAHRRAHDAVEATCRDWSAYDEAGAYDEPRVLVGDEKWCHSLAAINEHFEMSKTVVFIQLARIPDRATRELRRERWFEKIEELHTDAVRRLTDLEERHADRSFMDAAAASKAAYMKASDAEEAALERACRTVPTTLAGAHLLLVLMRDFLACHGFDYSDRIKEALHSLSQCPAIAEAALPVRIAVEGEVVGEPNEDQSKAPVPA